MKTAVQKKKHIHISHATSRKLNGLLFLLPWLTGFVLFFLMPLVNTVIYAFNSVQVADMGGIDLKFVGLQNFIDLFNTEVSSQGQQFIRVFTDENTNILINTPLIVIFSLFSAILINVKFRGRGIVRVIFFLPIILGVKVVTSLLMVSTGGDVVDAAVNSAFDPMLIVEFFINHTFLPVNVIIFILNVIGNIFSLISLAGVQTLVFLAGLQSINPSLYEVAQIEGATAYEVFWKITFPMLANVNLFAIIYTFVDLFLASPIAVEIYRFAFNKNNIGLGSALSLVYMINILIDLGLVMLVLAVRGRSKKL